MEEVFPAFVEYIRGQLVLGLMTRDAAMCQLVERLQRDKVPDPLAEAAGIMQAVALKRLVGANTEVFIPRPRPHLARPNHAHRTALGRLVVLP